MRLQKTHKSGYSFQQAQESAMRVKQDYNNHRLQAVLCKSPEPPLNLAMRETAQ